MDDKLKERLKKFEEEEKWAGIEPEDLSMITLYTLKALYGHLEENEPQAIEETSILGSAMDIVETYMGSV